MTSINSLLRLAIVFLLLSMCALHAQTACPPGMIPYGAGVCGYDNSQQLPPQEQPAMRPPPERWMERWGAIATDGPAGILGVATSMPSQSEAEQQAMIDCQLKGGKQCKLDGSYSNQCTAVVVGSKGYSVNLGLSVDAAVQKGMTKCSSTGGSGCHVYYSACSLPVQIQ